MNYFEAVYLHVQNVPRGKVATYQQIATKISTPRAARVVGFALRALPHDTDVPWQRVVNSRGMISIENLQFPKHEQARRLVGEGIGVEERDGNYYIDLALNLWQNGA